MDYQEHDSAGLFPMLGDEELRALADDIAARGQRDPIIVWGSRRMVVDGRNRLRACRMAGVEPVVSLREFATDEEAVWFSLSANVHRRHLSVSQKGMALAAAQGLVARFQEQARAKLAEQAKAKPRGPGGAFTAAQPRVETLPQVAPQPTPTPAPAPKSRDLLGAVAGISGKTVAAAIKVTKQGAPELAEAVRQNVIPVNMAERVVARPVEEQRRIVEKIAGGLAKNVPQAVRQLEEDQRKAEAAAIKAPVGARIVLGSALDHLDAFVGAHCVVTDPPYGIDVHRTRDGGKDYADGADYALELLDRTMAGLSERIAPDAHLYVFSGYSYVGAFKEILGRYFEVQDNPLIWAKTQQTMCDFSQWYASKHEYVLFARVRGSKRRLANGAVGDVFTFARGRETTHSAEKPVELLSTFIEQSTRTGELIVDPFTGSGSTAVAALRMARRFAGTEIDPEFHRLAETRAKGAAR